jgi:hypothetical protein
VPWERGKAHRLDVACDDDEDLVELAVELAPVPVPVPVPARRQRKRSLKNVCEVARKAGADRVIVGGVVIVLAPAAAVPASRTRMSGTPCCRRETMDRIKLLPHIQSFRNRHGTMVHYFRKRGCKIVRLRGLPGSSEFMRAYEAAIGNAEPIVIGADRAKVGTVAATVGMYLSSVAFADFATETKRTQRNILERFREAHGDKRIASIERKHVQALVDAGRNTECCAQPARRDPVADAVRD